jgi:beta-alanine degradation protein BauB
MAFPRYEREAAAIMNNFRNGLLSASGPILLAFVSPLIKTHPKECSMVIAKKWLVLVLVILFAGKTACLLAADPLQVAPAMYKLNFENDRVRVMEVTFKPGEKIPEHSHPDHFVYVLEGGQLTINKAGAAPSIADLKPGQVLWIPAESHWAQNTGKTKVRLLVNELKPAKMEMPK